MGQSEAGGSSRKASGTRALTKGRGCHGNTGGKQLALRNKGDRDGVGEEEAFRHPVSARCRATPESTRDTSYDGCVLHADTKAHRSGVTCS